VLFRNILNVGQQHKQRGSVDHRYFNCRIGVYISAYQRRCPDREDIGMKKILIWLRQNRHVWWSLCLPYILFMFFLPEHIVTADYWVSFISIDNLIPFIAPFVLFYCLWFPMLFFTGLWLLLKDADGFKKYMLYMTFAYTVSAAIFILFPNGQDLRPASFETRNIFTVIVGYLYSADTNTNVLPSMHVVGCFGITAALYDTKTIRRKWVRPLIMVIAVLVVSSTVFIKQHSVLDIAAGLVYSALLYALVYMIIGNGRKRREVRQNIEDQDNFRQYLRFVKGYSR